jgi:hypothetical protein
MNTLFAAAFSDGGARKLPPANLKIFVLFMSFVVKYPLHHWRGSGIIPALRAFAGWHGQALLGRGWGCICIVNHRVTQSLRWRFGLSRFGLLFLLDFGPGVFEADGFVEDEFVRC